jgi:hypothetical protein
MLTELHGSKRRRRSRSKERINNKNKNVIITKKKCTTSFSVNIHKRK